MRSRFSFSVSIRRLSFHSLHHVPSRRPSARSRVYCRGPHPGKHSIDKHHWPGLKIAKLEKHPGSAGIGRWCYLLLQHEQYLCSRAFLYVLPPPRFSSFLRTRDANPGLCRIAGSMAAGDIGTLLTSLHMHSLRPQPLEEGRYHRFFPPHSRLYHP